jgi:hypothetical protein
MAPYCAVRNDKERTDTVIQRNVTSTNGVVTLLIYHILTHNFSSFLLTTADQGKYRASPFLPENSMDQGL